MFQFCIFMDCSIKPPIIMGYPYNPGIPDISSFKAILWQMSSTFIHTSCFLILTLDKPLILLA